MSSNSPVVNTVSAGVTNSSFVEVEIEEDADKTKKLESEQYSENLKNMTDELLLSNGSSKGQRNIGKKASSFGNVDRLSQPGLELKFEHLNFSIKGKKILHDVSGTAHPGKVLAVMGPSGSGKTTLLNVLGGRIECSNCHATIGGQKLTKKTRRKISYVLQQDIFFPNLTLQQTLSFAAELRLPESLSSERKKEIVNQLIEQLDMQKCVKTIIGDNMNRGLSGGEKKRANIANELLTDPAVLLLDEPTSGLDSSTAYALTLSLKKYAVQSGKTVLMTIHQPSVQMFFQFDTILLLSGGQVAYYGSPEDVLRHFQDMGFSCDVTHYNPADFILDTVKSGSDASKRLIEASNKRRLNTPDCPVIPSEKQQLGLDEVIITSETDKTRFSKESEVSDNIVKSGGDVKSHQANGEKYRMINSENDIRLRKRNSETDDSDASLDHVETRWPTSYFHQLYVLTMRSFIQGKYRYLSMLKFVKTIGVALIMGLAWFQVGRYDVTESRMNDIVGSLFFLLVFNAFNSLFDVLVIFPSEREVVNKERMSGSYRLSAYYLSKTASELPLCLVLPSLATIIFYWLAGLNGYNNAGAFFGTWLVMIGTTIASQSLGLFVSAATMDFDHGLVLAIFIMITYMLLGGFYIKNFPSWLYWMRYLSLFMYSWTLMIVLEFDSDFRVLCNGENSVFPSCSAPLLGNGSSTISPNITRYVPASEIIHYYEADTPIWICVVAILATLVIFRVVGYFLLRLFHKPVVK